MEEFDLQGAAGQPVALPIGPGPATGYTWALTMPTGIQRLEDAAGPEVPAAHKLGAAAAGAIRVVAAAPGNYTIEGRLARPWDQEDVVRTVRIQLHIR
jgi:predicted secreted protein